MRTEPAVEDLLRELAPQVLGTLVRRHGQFDACEDAVQEALLAAAQQWTADDLPDHPRGWLVTVASRRLVDEWRSESARRRREESEAALELTGRPEVSDHDDTLSLLFMCCHPSLAVPSQLALTLRAVGGLSTAELAAAFLVPETDDGTTDQPGQADHQTGRSRLHAAPGRRARRPASGRDPGALPDLQRGLSGHLGTAGPARRPRRRGDPAGPPAAPAGAGRR